MPESKLGRIPRQQRAKETVNQIQKAAREILETQGVSGLNTNQIAEVAGVNVATVYRYYPDKYAILSHMFEQFETERREYVLSRIAELSNGASWRPWIESIIDDLAKFRERDASGVAMRRAMASSMELLELDRASQKEVVDRLGESIAKVYPHLDKSTARTVAFLVVDVITVALDQAYAEPEPDLALLRELKTLLGAYLAAHLDSEK